MIDEILDDIIYAEGGFTDHPDDRGGPTKYGITLDTLGDSRNIAASRTDILNLTEVEAREIYRQKYVVEPGFLDLPEQVLPVVVDSAVLHGPSRAIRMLQEAAGATIDGSLGPMTLKAVKALEGRSLVNSVSVIRLKFIADLIDRKQSQSVFLRGWTSRVTGYIN